MSPTELFEANRKLAFHFSYKYCRKYPWLDFDDLSQECLRGLWKSCEAFDPKHPDVCPFGAFATHHLKQVCWNFVRDHHRRLTEVSLSEPRGADETLTLADSVDADLADQELTAAHGDARLQSRLADLRDAIENLSTLTDRQRTILRLFSRGEHQAAIARKYRCSPALICSEMKFALKKLATALNGVEAPRLPRCQIPSAWDKTA